MFLAVLHFPEKHIINTKAIPAVRGPMVSTAGPRTRSGMETTTRKLRLLCNLETQRQCADGSCIPRMELCPEEEMLNQDTILIMIGVGMGVVLFLIILYCLQQRRSAGTDQGVPGTAEEMDNPELLMPPPSYREAMDVYLYPPTPQTTRNRHSVPSLEEPITPPPNYDAALSILAQSHESVLVGKEGATASSPTGTTPVLRRTLSIEHVGISRGRPMTFSSFGANSKTFTNTPREECT
ncbi:uncharacterized protein LOC143300851 [Babylonia areolata]|uniref:uncharacterized protein LOC143300851 n=1 Tax=Babylonia areolata TaxID=304850 RepID=UPI003FD33BF1